MAILEMWGRFGGDFATLGRSGGDYSDFEVDLGAFIVSLGRIWDDFGDLRSIWGRCGGDFGDVGAILGRI